MSAKNIALIDFHAVGHHPTYLKLFADAIGEELICVGAPVSAELHSIPESVERLPEFLPRWSRYWRWRGRAALESFERFLFLRKELRKVEAAKGEKIDHVFFACLYDDQFRGAWLWDSIWKWDWSALYLHPAVDVEKNDVSSAWRKNSLLTGLLLFDEENVENFSDAFPEKRFSMLPDIAFTGSKESGLVAKIRSLSEGRSIVVLSGYLGRPKGVLEFVRAAKKLEDSDLFFVLAGHINFDDFLPEEQSEIRLWAQESGNVFVYPDYLENEEILNGVIQMGSLIFAVYQDWPFSSNAVAKAACFDKPILVAQGHHMEKRVTELGIGEAVPEKDIEEIANAIERLAKQQPDLDAHRLARETLSFESFSTVVRDHLEIS